MRRLHFRHAAESSTTPDNRPALCLIACALQARRRAIRFHLLDQCMLVPGRSDMTVGYSGTPLPRKLGIKPGMSMAVLNAPANLEALLGELPDGVVTTRRLGGHRDLVVIFVTSQADFAPRIPALITAIAPDGMIWVAWPKRASKIETDMTEDVIREIVLPSSGLVDVKVCAIDHVWSGLKLVTRKERR
jgi:hypothetical protein